MLSCARAILDDSVDCFIVSNVLKILSKLSLLASGKFIINDFNDSISSLDAKQDNRCTIS